MGSTFDLWVKGYLGLFFTFDQFGWLNWLLIPILFYFLATIKKRKRWEVALYLSLCLSMLFISIFGYDQSRYQLTLFPVFIPVIFVFGYDYLKNKNSKIIMIVLFLVCGLLAGNFYSRFGNYRYYWNASIGDGQPGERFPYKLIQYINEKIGNIKRIQVQALPFINYHIKKGNKIGEEGRGSFILLRNASMEGHDLIFEDQGYKLYTKSKSDKKEILSSFLQRKPDTEIIFPKWIDSDEIPMEDISKILSPMKLLGVRNSFVFKYISSEGGDAIRVMLKEAEFNTKSVLQFGYIKIRKTLNLEIKDEDTLYVVARMRQSPLRRKSVQLFIQDKTDYWVREEADYTGKSWKDVLIGKRIRDGVKNICIGVSWKPESDDEWIEIQFIRMYVKKNEESTD